MNKTYGLRPKLGSPTRHFHSSLIQIKQWNVIQQVYTKDQRDSKSYSHLCKSFPELFYGEFSYLVAGWYLRPHQATHHQAKHQDWKSGMLLKTIKKKRRDGHFSSDVSIQHNNSVFMGELEDDLNIKLQKKNQTSNRHVELLNNEKTST